MRLDSLAEAPSEVQCLQRSTVRKRPGYLAAAGSAPESGGPGGLENPNGANRDRTGDLPLAKHPPGAAVARPWTSTTEMAGTKSRRDVHSSRLFCVSG